MVKCGLTNTGISAVENIILCLRYRLDCEEKKQFKWPTLMGGGGGGWGDLQIREFWYFLAHAQHCIRSHMGLIFVSLRWRNNYFFNIVISDSVTRMVYYKYLHPKEALISNGILNR